MKKQVWISVAALLAATAFVVAAAVAMLRPDDSATSAGQETAQSMGQQPGQQPEQQTEQSQGTARESVPARPDCPGGSVGGVDLPCLGGSDSGEKQQDITVVNVWAWWCEPCREELPALEEFAREHPEYTVVGVHADKNAAGGAALLNDVGVQLPSYQDEKNAFAGALGLPGVVPVTVIFKGDEKVGVVAKGFSSSSEIAQAVEEVL